MQILVVSSDVNLSLASIVAILVFAFVSLCSSIGTTGVILILVLKLLSTAVYRVSFHPLSKYPGPLLGRITDLYSGYHAWKGDRHHDFLHLHHKYGKQNYEPLKSVNSSVI